MTPVQPPPASGNPSRFQRLYIEATALDKIETKEDLVIDLAGKIEREARALSDSDELAPHFDLLAMIERAAKMIKEVMLEPVLPDDEPDEAASGVKPLAA